MSLVNRSIKIINSGDFEGSPKYFSIQKGSPIAYLHKNVLFSNLQEVCIFHVEITDDRTVNPNDPNMYGTGVLTGAVLGGFLGALLASVPGSIEWDVDFKIWLTDERYIMVNVKDETAVKLLLPYTKTSQWDLDKFNEKRKAKWQLELEEAEAESAAAKKELERLREEEQLILKHIESSRQTRKWKESIDTELLFNIKAKVVSFLEVGKCIDVFNRKQGTTQEYSGRTTLLYQLGNFCIYLFASSRDKTTDSDARIYSYIFDTAYSKEQLVIIAEKLNINRNHFGSEVPSIFKALVPMEQLDDGCNKYVAPFIEVHRMLCIDLIKLTDRTDENLFIGKEYVNRLERYAESESNKYLKNKANECTATPKTTQFCPECYCEAGSNDLFCAGCGVKLDGRLVKKEARGNIEADTGFVFSAGNYFVSEDIAPGRYDIFWVSGSGVCSVSNEKGYTVTSEIFSADSIGIRVFKNADLVKGSKIEVRGTLFVRFLEKQLLTTKQYPEIPTNEFQSAFQLSTMPCTAVTVTESNQNKKEKSPFEHASVNDFEYGVFRNGIEIKKFIGRPNTNYIKSMKCVIIPDVINGYAVIRIGANAFSSCDMDSVLMPPSVYEIGKGAFANCTNLRGISIPKGVYEIGKGAFANCTSLRSIDIPKGVYAIEEATFLNCGIWRLKIPSSVSKIGKYAFMGCKNIDTITIPKSIKVVGTQAFAKCSGMKSIAILNGLTYINSGMFEKCTGLTVLTLPESIEQILDRAFAECSALAMITLNEGLGLIAENAFSGCKKLYRVTIPNSLDYIHKSAFSDCVLLSDEVKKQIIERRSPDEGYDMNGVGPSCYDDIIREMNWDTDTSG